MAKSWSCHFKENSACSSIHLLETICFLSSEKRKIHWKQRQTIFWRSANCSSYRLPLSSGKSFCKGFALDSGGWKPLNSPLVVSALSGRSLAISKRKKPVWGQPYHQVGEDQNPFYITHSVKRGCSSEREITVAICKAYSSGDILWSKSFGAIILCYFYLWKVAIYFCQLQALGIPEMTYTFLKT